MSKSWDIRGVEEKLKRANENIVNVTTEIDAIIGPDRDRIRTDDNKEAVDEFLQASLARPVPPRVSVLAAECAHNLRSALDQLAWQLVIAGGGTPGDGTHFPLRLTDPAGNKGATTSYNAAVEGMSTAAKAYILALQPFQPGNGGKDHKLRILHDMNITDKHHELVIVKNAVRTEHRVKFVPEGIGLHRIAVGEPKDGAVPIAFDRPVRSVQMNVHVSMQIVFADFGDSRLVPVPDGLWSLYKAVDRAVTEVSTLRFP